MKRRFRGRDRLPDVQQQSLRPSRASWGEKVKKKKLV